jgi:hypothetical protein
MQWNIILRRMQWNIILRRMRWNTSGDACDERNVSTNIAVYRCANKHRGLQVCHTRKQQQTIDHLQQKECIKT